MTSRPPKQPKEKAPGCFAGLASLFRSNRPKRSDYEVINTNDVGKEQTAPKVR